MCWAEAGYSASTTKLHPGTRTSAHEVPDRMRVSRSRTPACHRRIRVDAGYASRSVAERLLCKAERESARGPTPVGHRKWTEWTARIALQQPSLSSRDTLQQLHWLPVKWRIQFKLASLTYKVLRTGTPSYLSEHLHPYVPSRTLRSWSSANLYKLAYNVRPSTIFILVHAHISAPTVCNCLLSTLCLSRTLNTFRKHLKTNLFQSAFNSPLRLVQHLWFILLNDYGT